MNVYAEIKLLEKDVADKIAAGEVVERPLSVVKELTENSIDAGASSVTVEINHGGKDYIRVTDNGRGIPHDQVGLAFMRHATSKIRLESDLSRISTLGFRGEALASIAAVSKTELITRTADEKAGTRIRINGGETEEICSVASDEGTTIIVRDLFYNTPARRKFLKSDSAESALIVDYLSKMALAYPGVRIRVKSNGSILFSTLGGGDLYKAVLTVFGSASDFKLLPVDYCEGTLSVKGYVSAPTASRRDRRLQIFFVNDRLVRNKTLERALDQAYHDKLFEGRMPLAFLFVGTDPSEVDVNIHPHKTEIKFYDDNAVYEFMVRGIRRALLAPDAGSVGGIMAEKAEMPEPERTYQAETIPDPVSDSGVSYGNVIKLSSTDNTDFFSGLREQETAQALYGKASEQQVIEEASFDKDLHHLKFSSLEPVGQVFATYIVLRDESYVYFVDQHAAHERVLYERLLAAFNSGENASQLLMMPQIVQLSAAGKAAAEDKIDLLRRLGYRIEDFGPSEFIVKEVPAYFGEADAVEFLREVLDSNVPDVQAKRDEIIMASCKGAVKGNDILAPEEIRQLFADLDACENPYNCPHGRPTYIRFSQYDLEKMFKRK